MPLPGAGRGWGGVTRRGAAVVRETETASAEWQRAVARARQAEPARREAPPRASHWEPEVWVEVDTGRPRPPTRSQTGRQPPATKGRPRPDSPGKRPSARTAKAGKERLVAADVAGELAHAGGPRRAATLQRKLAEAIRAFDAERYQDAARLLAPLAEAAPAAGTVRELHGLTLYRLGRWRAALKELEAAHELTGSFAQHPVMADCQRALGRHQRVEALWDDLRHASAPGEVVAEGRIVMAGSLADRGDTARAIQLLEPFGVDRARPREFHLRTWYVLADLYERAGDVPRARELFRRLVQRDPDFHDVVQRLAAL